MIGSVFLFWGCITAKTKDIVPNSEFIQSEATSLPTETVGIRAVDTLGFINLKEEFPALENELFFRLRRLEIDPGGSAAAHEHNNRPGVAYILSGSITEYRKEGSYVRNTGDHSFEYTGIQHGWRNHTDQPVQAIVVDVLAPKERPEIPNLPEQKPFVDAPAANNGLSMLKKELSSLNQEGMVFSDKSLRFRVVSLSPNGVVAAHTHQSRPSFAYVLSGTVVEHRGDADYTHQSGSSVAERNGLSHWWKNTGDSEAKLLVVDIISQE